MKSSHFMSMKFMLGLSVLAAAVAATNAFSAEPVREASFLRTFPSQTCSFWTNIRDASGMFAYGCSSYPTSVTLADGNDVARVIATLESRIAELEKRVAELAAKP